MGTTSSVAQAGVAHDEDYYCDYSDSQPKWMMYKDDVATLRFAKKGIWAKESDGGCKVTTMFGALKDAAEKWPDSAALRVERPLPPLEGKEAPPSAPVEEWKTWTFSQYYQDSRNVAKGFLKLGAVRYDGVNILGFNSPEWFMAEVGAMMMGGLAAGVYPSDTPDQIKFKTSLADGAVAVVDNKASFDKYAQVVDDLPYLKAIVTWEYPEAEDLKRADGSVVKVLTWDDLIELGKTGSDEELDKLSEATQPGNAAALVFTSGTTGNPKAVMLSHDNLVAEGFNVLKRGILKFSADVNRVERIISYLPLSHVAGMMVDVISPVVATAYGKSFVTVHFARPYDLKAGTIGVRLKAVRPTFFLGVPRVWEKIAEKLKAVGAQTKGLKKSLSTWAKSHALYHQKNCEVGGSGATGWGFTAASLLLNKIKEALGLNECHFMLSGAAPLTIETLEYFAALGININEVYGMSESSGSVTWSTDECHKWGSIGYEMEGTEVKVFQIDADGSKKEAEPAENWAQPPESSQGELCFRGRQIMMGYLANPKLGEDHVAEMKKKNAEAIDENGWMHSGDKGSRGNNNMFQITGRYKELIITAGGENVAPVPIESALKQNCPAISNAMMVGDKRKFNTVLLTLKAIGATGELPGSDDLEDIAKIVPGVNKISEAVESPEYIKAITDAIIKTCKDGSVCPSNASKIQKFSILKQDFSVETGEITPSLKLKRSVVAEKHASLIDKLYSSKETFVKAD